MFCPDCGLKNRSGAKFCRTCGKNLKNLPGFTSSDSDDKKSQPSAVSPGKPPLKKSSPQSQAAIPAVVPPIPDMSSLPSGLLQVGDMIDRRYKVTSHIATGGMGAIYKGEDTRLQTVVAIKEMIDFFQTEEEKNYAIKRFREEALLLADIRHPNIPRVTDNFIENGKYYLIMDFVEGKSAEKVLKENSGRGLPEDRILKWAIQTCDVLDYLHTLNPPIIYRDMKPSNVMILDDDRVMLVDFGIARHFSPRRPGTMIGTHGYAPPEQYKGNTEPRSDLYALAATLHHLLSGNDPTKGVPFNFKPIRQWRPDVSEGMEKILSCALENLPDRRFATAGEMKREFEKLAGNIPLGSTASQPSSYVPPVSQHQTPPPPPMRRTPQGSSSPSGNRSKRSEAEAEKYYEKGKRYFNAGNIKKASDELNKAVRACPNHAEAQCLLGYVRLKMGDSQGAVNHLMQSVMLSPKSATAHLYLGKAYARMGRIQESQKEYKIAGRLDPRIFNSRSPGLLEKLLRSILS